MAINTKMTPEELKAFMNPESFESESILSKDRELKEIPVTIDELVPWNRNPRIFRNPKYDEIKESIRISGLKQKPGITKRPGDSHYMIESGGNTRLQILKELVEEIDAEMDQIKAGGEDLDRIAELTRKRDSFYNIKCVFTPWEELDRDTDSEINLLAGHMVENELRGEMIFIERALAVTRLRKLFEEKEGKELSARKLAEAIKSTGWTGVNDSAISQYEYAVRELYDFLPIAFECGMGFAAVKRLRKYHTCIEQLWEHAEVEGKSVSGWEKIWQEALSECDGEVFDFNRLTDKIEARLAQALGCNITQITAELFRLGEKGTDPADSLLNRAEESNVTPFSVPGNKVGNNSQHNSAATGSVNGHDADRYLDYEDHPSDFTELQSNRTIAARLEELKQKAAARSEAKGEHNIAAASGSANTAGSAAGNYGGNDSAGGYSSRGNGSGNSSGSSFEQEVSSAPVDEDVWTVSKRSAEYLCYADLEEHPDIACDHIKTALYDYASRIVQYLVGNINDFLRNIEIATSDYMQVLTMSDFSPIINEVNRDVSVSANAINEVKRSTGLKDDKEVLSYADFFLSTPCIGYAIKTNPHVMVGTINALINEGKSNHIICFTITRLIISIISKAYAFIPEFGAPMNIAGKRRDKWHKGQVIEEIMTVIGGIEVDRRNLHILYSEEPYMLIELFPLQRDHLERINRVCYRIGEINAVNTNMAKVHGGEA